MTLANLVRRPVRQPLRHPFRDARSDFDRLVDDLFSGFGLAPVAFAPHAPAAVGFTPAVDAVELENEYRVTADIPGVDPADVEVTVEDGVLTIKGQRYASEELRGSAEPRGDAGNESEAGAVSRIRERGRFERCVRFPGDIVENEVKAVHRHGVLTVTVPKRVEPRPEVRSIPVETA